MRSSFEIKPKSKPKWFELRRQTARGLVWIARQIYPASPEVQAFLLECLVDSAIYGQHIVRVNPLDMINQSAELND